MKKKKLTIKKTFSLDLSPQQQSQLLSIVLNFEKRALQTIKKERNTIKTATFNGFEINIKSFKKPNLINKIVYKFFRKSKAERSFLFAHKLLENGIKTPQPLAFFEYTSPFFFGKSFYVSKNLNYDFTIREIIDNDDFNDSENIIRQFTRFTFNLHQNNINFLDHSPGNTLIVKKGKDYEFYLVDLNRMEFKPMDFNARMNNFAKLSSKKYMNSIIANEYAKLYPAKSEEEILKKLMYYSDRFKNKFLKKQAFKKKYFFWRNK